MKVGGIPFHGKMGRFILQMGAHWSFSSANLCAFVVKNLTTENTEGAKIHKERAIPARLWYSVFPV